MLVFVAVRNWLSVGSHGLNVVFELGNVAISLFFAFWNLDA
jgi:hypothetical protein